MPRANIAAVHAWRAEFAAEKRHHDASAERLTQGWSFLVLMLMLLYVLIGHAPYQHDVALDADTGAAEISPVNRYIWILLAAMSMPLLWARRDQLVAVLKRLWLLVAVFVWFFLTTLWALDPAAAHRRFFLYIIAVIISLALVLGFNDSKKLHYAFVVTCGVMVMIDLLSWLILPRVSMTDVGLAAIHSHKNTLGAVMLFCGIVIGPYLMVEKPRGQQVFWSFMMVAVMALLVASQSKTSLSILLVTIFLCPFILFVLKLRGQTIHAIIATIIMMLFFGVLGYLAWCTATGLDPLAPFQGITFTQRTDVWVFVFAEIFKHPLIGSGFGSFWDIDPLLQPSLNAGLWFGSPDLANQAHNGYLDLLVTTGVIGLVGALALLFGWFARGFSELRRILQSNNPADRWNIGAATTLGLFPLLIFVHNWMESSYFTANTIFGTLILVIGMDLDLNRFRTPSVGGGNSSPSSFQGRR